MSTNPPPRPLATPAPTSVAPPAPPPAGPMTLRPSREQARAGWPVRIALLIVVILFLIPTLGLLVTSFRSREDAGSSSWWGALFNPGASAWTLANYGEVLSQGMGNAFVNSLVVTVPATVIPILIAAMAAYAFTFIDFKGRDFAFIAIVALLVVPAQVSFIPLLQLFGTLNITGTFAAVWLAHTGYGMPLAVYLLRTYMSTLPKAVIESAKIDGATHYQTFWKLILPMSFPALASFAIFQFLWVWNDLLVALIFLGAGPNETVTLNLQSLLGTFGSRWDLLAPGAFITLSLPLIVFFALQRYFERGMTAGSVKG
jgi:alpha-glucoside transport system permease protein